jgi:hypothetical protein|eukprot:COSAG06_NODE_3313_length_5520_cov_2.512910_6_plen_40_part_00
MSRAETQRTQPAGACVRACVRACVHECVHALLDRYDHTK